MPTLTEAGDVKVRRLVLVVDANIDVADADNVADILCCAVVFLVHGRVPSSKQY
jgi:hypothetical protein